jgi:DNA-directed RNA polymerase specialized sigma subunit
MLEGQILFAESECVTDVVQGSSSVIPYAKQSIVVKGYGSQAIPRLQARKAQHEAECEAVERYIEAMGDSITRQLLIRRYIENRTLGETAQLIGYSETQVKRLIKSFFVKMKTL